MEIFAAFIFYRHLYAKILFMFLKYLQWILDNRSVKCIFIKMYLDFTVVSGNKGLTNLFIFPYFALRDTCLYDRIWQIFYYCFRIKYSRYICLINCIRKAFNHSWRFRNKINYPRAKFREPYERIYIDGWSIMNWKYVKLKNYSST